jgi:tetratricopeptide (TPR) repeat protein
MPSQEIIDQKNSAANAEQVSESNLELVPQPKQEHDTAASPQGLPHAFVVMPFGKKKGPDDRWIDFNSIYQDLIKPALIEAGFEPFRADEESVSGDILTDMFQELLLADLVIADLSIDNANVFYELGVRHALRKRGLIHIQSGRGYLPFDIFNVRTLPYHCDENGRPERQYLEKDKQAIAKMARATWESDHHRIHSPIFNLLDGLEEPDRRSLQTPLAIGYWDEYNNWRKRVVIAQRQDRIGDVLLLTEEVSNPLIKCEAIAEAGKALRNLENYQLALQQYRKGLALQPKNSEFRREEAFHLSRLKLYDEAVVQLESLLRDEPANIDAISYLGRIYKEMWKERWVGLSNQAERCQTAYASAHLLQKAIESYLQAYRLDQNHYYSGINALTLSAVFKYLARHGRDGDPEEKAIKEQLPALSGAVKFSLESAAIKDNNDVWVFLSLGDLAICTASNPQQAARAYKRALNRLWNNKFALLSTLEQLKLLESLKFRIEYVKSGLDVLEAELKRIEHQEAAIASQTVKTPSQVFLFSGHMIDKQDRERPRFPAAMEREVQQKIKEVLDELQADANDLAIAPGIACGGDILFLEACLERQMNVVVYLPFESAQFIEKSVNFAGDDWVERFYRIKNHPQVKLNLQQERIGAVPQGGNSFERNNRWALYSSLIYGIDRVRLIVLWDGKGGDGRGGTGDMVKQVRQLGGIVEHLDTTKFDYWKAQGAGIGNRET